MDSMDYQKPRNLSVPALRKMSGGGAHTDRKHEAAMGKYKHIRCPVCGTIGATVFDCQNCNEEQAEAWFNSHN